VVIDRYLLGEYDGAYMPKAATTEHKLLSERSRTNLLPLVVNGVAQALYVEGYRRSDTAAPARAWQWWQHNDPDTGHCEPP
jgi:hypothetical protein